MQRVSHPGASGATQDRQVALSQKNTCMHERTQAHGARNDVDRRRHKRCASAKGPQSPCKGLGLQHVWHARGSDAAIRPTNLPTKTMRCHALDISWAPSAHRLVDSPCPPMPNTLKPRRFTCSMQGIGYPQHRHPPPSSVFGELMASMPRLLAPSVCASKGTWSGTPHQVDEPTKPMRYQAHGIAWALSAHQLESGPYPLLPQMLKT